MTPEEAQAQPGAFVAYRRTDGECIGEFAWVTEKDWFDEYGYLDDPYEVEEVVMVPVIVRTFWVGTHDFEPCDDAPDKCEQCGGIREGHMHTEATR